MSAAKKRPTAKPPSPRTATCTRCLRAVPLDEYLWLDHTCESCWREVSRAIEGFAE